jgi:hypothetical protein
MGREATQHTLALWCALIGALILARLCTTWLRWSHEMKEFRRIEKSRQLRNFWRGIQHLQYLVTAQEVLYGIDLPPVPAHPERLSRFDFGRPRFPWLSSIVLVMLLSLVLAVVRPEALKVGASQVYSDEQLQAIVERTPDLSHLRILADRMNETVRRALFEKWAKRYILNERNPVRVVVAENPHLQEVDGRLSAQQYRDIDDYHELTGEIWNTRIYEANTTPDLKQLHDYRIMQEAGHVTATDGRTIPVNGVNYIFCDAGAAHANADLVRREGGAALWYVANDGKLNLLP